MTSWRQDEATSAQKQKAHGICDQQQQTQTVSRPHSMGESMGETHRRQQAAKGADDTCLRKQVGVLKTSKVSEGVKRHAVIKRVQTIFQSDKSRQVSDQRRKPASDQHKKVHGKLSAKERLAGKDVENASSTMTARLAGTLSVALVVGLGFYKYGLYVALASGGWPVFFMTVLMAFEDTTRGMCVQASALALALGVIVGAAALQRHDYPVLVALSITIMVLIVMAPLTEANLASFAHVSAACSVLCILVTASVTGHEVASSMIAISVPAYMCALIGAVHAAFSSPSLLFPKGAALAGMSVLVGSWGASHDPPMNDMNAHPWMQPL